MTEIMPVPRNSHITVLRPPSIGGGFFACRNRILQNVHLKTQGKQVSGFDGLCSLVYDILRMHQQRSGRCLTCAHER